jgi:thymidylate synthase (FAD)
MNMSENTCFNGQTIKLLDHGYLTLIDSMGTDRTIIESARMSTDKGFLGWGFRCENCGHDYGETSRLVAGNWHVCPSCKLDGKIVHGDTKLLAYLYENRHDTPFEMCEIVFEVKAPIFVFREWHRHRTESYNEMSARYIPIPDEHYTPAVDRCIVPAGRNRQANGTRTLPGELCRSEIDGWLERLAHAYRVTEEVYQEGLALGIPKEIARCPMAVARYSKMRAKANLRNWMAFLTLRSDDAAQHEIRQYAYAAGWFLSKLYSHTWNLFLNHERRAPSIDHEGFLRMEAT